MIVAISGPAGAGKSTVARILRDKRGFNEIALADPMKRIAADLFAFSHDQLHGPSENRNAIDARYGVSPRFVLQQLGTEFGRRCYENVWVERLIREAKHFDRVVVPDLRFANEVAALRRAGAFLIRLRRAGTMVGDTHASETEQRGIPDSAFDLVIDNRDLTLGELEAVVLAEVPYVHPPDDVA